MNCAPGYAAPDRCSGSGWPSTPARALLPVLYLGPRTQHAAHRVIHSLRELLAPGCVPLFTSDGLNLSFYALTAHFGQWLQVVRRGRNVSEWQVAAELIDGQVKKCSRRRKLVRVTHVMRLGTEDALKAALQGLGFSGRLNTAFIERAPLTVRHGLAALARRTWATAQQSPHLLAHLEWWRADSHGCRAPMYRCAHRLRNERNARKEERKARHAGKARWAFFFISTHSLDPDADSVTHIPGDWFGPDIVERCLGEAIKTDLLFGDGFQLELVAA
jgi:hypothetical protein